MAEKRVDFAFNKLGQYTSVTRYKDTDGSSTNKVMAGTFQYDSLNRLTNLDYKNNSGGNIVTPFTWTYDSLSTPGLPAVQFGGVSLPGDPRVATTAALSTPLGAGRITQMTGEDGTVDYGYDPTSQLTSADRVLWPLVDHLGTVRDLVKQDGTVAAHFQYDAFGRIVSGDTSLTRYLFTSRDYDADTGLQYNRARWYDPATGRWISGDPLGFAAGDVNTARYVGNSLANLADATGLAPPLSNAGGGPDPREDSATGDNNKEDSSVIIIVAFGPWQGRRNHAQDIAARIRRKLNRSDVSVAVTPVEWDKPEECSLAMITDARELLCLWSLVPQRLPKRLEPRIGSQFSEIWIGPKLFHGRRTTKIGSRRLACQNCQPGVHILGRLPFSRLPRQ